MDCNCLLFTAVYCCSPAPFLWTLCLSSDRVSRTRAKRSDAKTRKILGKVTTIRSLRKVTSMKSRRGRMKRRRSPRKVTRRRPLRKVARMKSGRGRITRSGRNVKKVPIPLRRRRPLRKVTRRRIKRSGSLRKVTRRRPLRKLAPMMKLDPTQHVGIRSNLIQWACEPHAEIKNLRARIKHVCVRINWSPTKWTDHCVWGQPGQGCPRRKTRKPFPGRWIQDRSRSSEAHLAGYEATRYHDRITKKDL